MLSPARPTSPPFSSPHRSSALSSFTAPSSLTRGERKKNEDATGKAMGERTEGGVKGENNVAMRCDGSGRWCTSCRLSVLTSQARQVQLNQQVAVRVGPAREPTLVGHLNHRPARANLWGRARRPLVACLTGPSTSTAPPPLWLCLSPPNLQKLSLQI